MPLSRRKRDKTRPRTKVFDLSLYVAGTGVRSLRTIQSVKAAFEQHAPGRYSLTIVDIYRAPEAAVKAQIVAVPTLIQNHPRPVRMFVGDIPTPACVAEVMRIKETAA
jgi:circadian clock protein KaiB